MLVEDTFCDESCVEERDTSERSLEFPSVTSSAISCLRSPSKWFVSRFASREMMLTIRGQGGFFPEITGKYADLKEILDEEEESFSRTLDRGEKLFDTYAAATIASGSKTLAGKDVWRLYDTFGFPVDLTLLMAEEIGLSVDQTEFEKAQAASKEISKGGGKKTEGLQVKFDVHDIAALESNDTVPKTQDEFKFGQSRLSLFVLQRLTTRRDRPGQRRRIGQGHLLLLQVLQQHERTSAQLSLRNRPRQDQLLRRIRRTGERYGSYRHRRQDGLPRR